MDAPPSGCWRTLLRSAQNGALTVPENSNTYAAAPYSNWRKFYNETCGVLIHADEPEANGVVRRNCDRPSNPDRTRALGTPFPRRRASCANAWRRVAARERGQDSATRHPADRNARQAAHEEACQCGFRGGGMSYPAACRPFTWRGFRTAHMLCDSPSRAGQHVRNCG